MSSTVTGSVLSWPCSTIPRESPISNTSTPAVLSRWAKVASYAVRQVDFYPDCLSLLRVVRVMSDRADASNSAFYSQHGCDRQPGVLTDVTAAGAPCGLDSRVFLT